ncbi:MAG: hypothetical protein ACC656_06165 [Candidatus Heimdallarchaeota archaeon]
MASYNYFAFEANDISDPLAGGTLSEPVLQTTATIPTGEICQPADITKISPGTAYSQVDDIIVFQDMDNENVTVSGITKAEWNNVDQKYNGTVYGSGTNGVTLKESWFAQWMEFLDLEDYINDPIFVDILQDFEDDDYFQQLSGLSISYLSQAGDTLELSLSVNCYQTSFFTDWLNSNSGSTVIEMKTKIKSSPHFISNAGKIEYFNDYNYVWSFDTRKYNYDGDGVTSASLTNGGGNIFYEIKFASLEYEALYSVKKDVDPRDPTFGLCSGEDKPFCVADEIFVIDISSLTRRTYSGTGNDFIWTWMGSPSAINREWYIANISDPCNDYTFTPISEMLFPLRVISECEYGDFG